MKRWNLWWMAFAATLLVGCQLRHVQEASPRYFGATPGALAESKMRLRAGDKTLRPALEELLRDADKALLVTPLSVTQKTRIPPSGDRHDYLSTAPYYWPDSSKKDGLPYIRHDGEMNPESRGSGYDRDRIGRMAGTVETLSLAYYFTGKEIYARHATRCLRVWFLDPATRMNPNLNFAQGIPGINDGRGIGIIEGRTIAVAADAAELLAGSSSWSQADDNALKIWLENYLNWLLTSKNGHDEAAARNNHGTFYDLQAVRLALILGKNDLAKEIAESVKQKRIAVQIEPDGRQPLELERTASLGYSQFNVEALFMLATLSEHVGVDLFHFETPDGRSVRRALDFLLPYVDVPAKPWPYEQIKKDDTANIEPALRQAALAYHDSKYEDVLTKQPDVIRQRFQLLYPKSKLVR